LSRLAEKRGRRIEYLKPKETVVHDDQNQLETLARRVKQGDLAAVPLFRCRLRTEMRYMVAHVLRTQTTVTRLARWIHTIARQLALIGWDQPTCVREQRIDEITHQLCEATIERLRSPLNGPQELQVTERDWLLQRTTSFGCDY
jgi:hypothetical protein